MSLRPQLLVLGAMFAFSLMAVFTRGADAGFLGIALWRAGEKWEFEGRQTVSLADDASLNSRLVLRRIGHDLIFELQYGLRSGEGGSSLGISVKPLLGWKPTRGGLLERWKDEND